MTLPERTVTQATITVRSELSERELEIEIAERLRGLQIEVRVEKVLIDHADKEFNGSEKR